MKRRIFVTAALAASCGGGAHVVSKEPGQVPEGPQGPDSTGIIVLEHAPSDALVLSVRAVRWRCSVTHAHGIETDVLTVPAGRPIRLVIDTPEPPEWAPGMEAALEGTSVVRPIVKGSPAELVFRIDAPGQYAWRCPTIVPPPREPDPDAEPSARIDESDRPVKPITVLAAAEYDEFIAANNTEDPEVRGRIGRALYEKKGCVSCHALDGSTKVGPSWRGIWGSTVTLSDGREVVVDAAYVRRSIVAPAAFARPGFPPSMPSFEGQLTERELDALVGFIESLR